MGGGIRLMGMKPATEHAKAHGKEKVLIKSFPCVLCALWLVFCSFAQETDALAAAKAVEFFEKGKTLLSRAEWNEAAAAFAGAHAAFETANDRQGQAACLNALGAVHNYLGNYGEALAFHRRGLAMREDLRDERGIAASLNNIALVHENLGDYQSALEFHRRGLAAHEKISYAKGRAASLHNLGNAYFSLGDHARAASFFRRSLALKMETGDRGAQVLTLFNIGSACLAMGDYAGALASYEATLPAFEETGDRAGLAAALGGIGNVRQRMGDETGAMAFYRRSLSHSEEIGDRAGRVMILFNAARLRVLPPGERMEHAQKALSEAQAAASPGLLFWAHAAAAEASAASELPEEAAAHYHAAIEATENMRSMLSGSDDKSGFLSTKLSAYEGLVEVLLASSPPSPLSRTGEGVGPGVGGEAEAFSTAERMRARSFLDEIGAARFAREGVPPELMEKKRLLEARMKWLAERQ